MATQKDSKSENLKKIQVLEPPQIDLRTEPKLVGTNGMFQALHRCGDTSRQIFFLDLFVYSSAIVRVRFSMTTKMHQIAE